MLADLDQHHRAAHRHVIWRRTEHDSEGEDDDCTGRTYIFCSSWEEAPAHIDLLFLSYSLWPSLFARISGADLPGDEPTRGIGTTPYGNRHLCTHYL